MNIIGIIIESNPFHNGHQYFIDQIRHNYSPDLLVAINTTSFTMRGEISIIDKKEKTTALLNAGVDVVLEYPFILSTQSSDYFSQNAIEILNSFGVNKIVCGCETLNLELFDKIYNIENNSLFKKSLKENLKKFNSYKKTYNETLAHFDLTNEEIKLFSEPNFTLAYQYFKTIKNNYSNISFSLVKRTNHYDELSLNKSIVSAKAIRYGLLNNENIDPFVPISYNYIDILKAEYNLFNLLKYNILVSNNTLNKAIDPEGIANLIKKNINNSLTFSDLINNLANKRYSASKIRRYILYLLLNIDKFYHKQTYLRILGINSKGTLYINSLSKDIKKLIFANANEQLDNETIKNILKIELNATMLYSIISKNQNFFENEFKYPIIKKE